MPAAEAARPTERIIVPPGSDSPRPATAEDTPTYRFKLLVVGDARVGKLGLVHALLKDEANVSPVMESGDCENIAAHVAVDIDEVDRLVSGSSSRSGGAPKKAAASDITPSSSTAVDGDGSELLRSAGSTAIFPASKDARPFVRIDITVATPTPSMRSAMVPFYEGIAAVLYTYDPNERTSFEDLGDYVDDVEQVLGNNSVVSYVVATAPAPESGPLASRAVANHEGEDLSYSHGGHGFLDFTSYDDATESGLLSKIAARVVALRRQRRPVLCARLKKTAGDDGDDDAIGCKKKKSHCSCLCQ